MSFASSIPSLHLIQHSTPSPLNYARETFQGMDDQCCMTVDHDT